MFTIRLKAGREKSVLRRHPWVFSGAIEELIGAPAQGDTVKIVDQAGKFLAWGAYSPHSQIRVRVWSFEEKDTIDESFLQLRLEQALKLRHEIFSAGEMEALRLVHGESDGLPGLIVDRYGDLLVMQCLSSGPELWRETLVDLLVKLTGIGQVYERSDVDVRQLEGLADRVGALRGGEPPERVLIHENGLSFWVDVRSGHKTGFYLDQRTNRLRVRQIALDKDVLDCFAYSGGFSVNALAGGASSVIILDSSRAALELASENLAQNNLPVERVEFIEADVFNALRGFRDRGRSYDLIVLDPPKFAPTAAQAEKASRGYKDINLLALKLLRPGGFLFTFSCSGGISPDLFQKIVAGAALDAGVDARIVERLHQDADHPVALNFPEGEYLKGLVVWRAT
ncbi:MAG: class I SAM-dependent methyltransferase [Anaerolineales bacterium]|nr:class I SAM-dependent methyltransferase [Anaerolineales bacterium]